MTPAELRADECRSYELALAEIRAAMQADCRTPNPISRREAWGWPKMLDGGPRPLGEIVAGLLPEIAARMQRRGKAA